MLNCPILQCPVPTKWTGIFLRSIHLMRYLFYFTLLLFFLPPGYCHILCWTFGTCKSPKSSTPMLNIYCLTREDHHIQEAGLHSPNCPEIHHDFLPLTFPMKSFTLICHMVCWYLWDLWIKPNYMASVCVCAWKCMCEYACVCVHV